MTEFTDIVRPDPALCEALQKIGNCDLESAKKEMYTLSIQEFWTPASPTWPLVG